MGLCLDAPFTLLTLRKDAQIVYTRMKCALYFLTILVFKLNYSWFTKLLVSGVQQNYIYIYIYNIRCICIYKIINVFHIYSYIWKFISMFFSIMVYYRTLNIVPCVNTLGTCCLSILYISSSLKFKSGSFEKIWVPKVLL